VAAKSGQFTADETGKGQFLEETEGICKKGSCEKDFVSTKSSECFLSLQWSEPVDK